METKKQTRKTSSKTKELILEVAREGINYCLDG